MIEWRALLLVVAANAAPVVASKLARNGVAAPLDFGYVMPDGERLFGAHKTWRGLLVGTAACALVAGAMGLPAWIGVGFGAVSLLGDALSSALKRRLRFAPGREAIGLDQFGEAFLPLVTFARPLGLQLTDVFIVTAAFLVLDVLVTPLRQRSWFNRASREDCDAS